MLSGYFAKLDMRNDLVVLDASIVVKWFHEESDTPLAQSFQERMLAGEIRVSVPPLLFYEVANVLTLKAPSEINAVEEALSSLQTMPFQVVEVMPGILIDGVRLAHQFRISVYDALYVALALFLKGVVITADKKLKEKVNLPCIRLLSE